MPITQIMAILLVGVFLITGACAPASTPAPGQTPAPASAPVKGFTVSDLIIPTLGESSGEGVEIGVTVTNNGKEQATHTLAIKVDGVVDSTQDVTLAGGASRHVIFTINIAKVGTSVITVEQLSGNLYWLGPN